MEMGWLSGEGHRSSDTSGRIWRGRLSMYRFDNIDEARTAKDWRLYNSRIDLTQQLRASSKLVWHTARVAFHWWHDIWPLTSGQLINAPKPSAVTFSSVCFANQCRIAPTVDKRWQWGLQPLLNVANVHLCTVTGYSNFSLTYCPRAWRMQPCMDHILASVYTTFDVGLRLSHNKYSVFCSAIAYQYIKRR